MLRNLLDEVMRRRLWPILLGAVVVAVAAPLLFLKSGADVAPVSTAAPAPAKPGELPARAQRLLATSAAATRAARRRASSASDPFQAPASQRPTVDGEDEGEDASKPTAAAAAAAGGKPVPVVVTNADGTTAQPSATPVTVTTTTPSTSAPTQDAPTKTVPSRSAGVDVRYSERLPGHFYRSIPRYQTFVAGGRVIAVFVKYSPNRRKAVFAIGPRTLVTGDVECRRKEGVCRYVDVPAGKHVRLTTLSASGKLVTRRLDVVRIDRSRSFGGAAAAARSAPADGVCLLGKLLALSTRDSPLPADACKS